MTAEFAQKYGRWGVIAGASEGVGASLADQLAGHGLNLVLIARNSALLEELSANVSERHGVEVVAAVGGRGVHVQIATQVGECHEPREATAGRRLDLPAVLSELGVDP